MKKHGVTLLIILIISLGLACILPSYWKRSQTIELPGTYNLILLTFIFFVFLALSYFAFGQLANALYNPNQQKDDKGPSLSDGYHILYNDKGQVTKEGVFDRGKLLNGTKRIYKKDGSLSHIEIYKNGAYVGNTEQ